MRPEETKPGKRILAYAITTMKDGRRVIEVVPEFKIKQHQASSRAGASSPWKTHEDEMWLKTAVRIACRLLPKSTALAQAVHLDTQVEAGIDQDLGRGMVVDAELLSAGVEEDAKAPETAEGGAQEQKPAARKARPKEKAVAEPAQPEADKATAKAAEPEKVTPDQVKALFTLAAQIHGAEGREAVREVMRIHGYKIAAHIPGSEWATVEREVRAWKAPGGSALDAPAGSDREDGDPGPEEELPF
jgi:recombination protein RecT